MHDYLKRAGELWEDSTGARHDNSPETTVLWRDQVIKGLPKPVQTALEDVLNLEMQPFHDWKQTVTRWYTRHQRKMDQEDDELRALTKQLLKAQVAEKDNETNKEKAKAMHQMVLTALDTEVRGAPEGDHLEEAAAVANLPMPIKCQRPLGPLRTSGIPTNRTEAAQSPLQALSYQYKLSRW
ncbi:hypothetical protein NQZ68_025945 [Dissostichus eleginoides]|nr:hypothetical protein NQZ68_025945 [Dissostichus eleginoides]